MYYLLDLLLLYSLIGNVCDATVHFSEPHRTPYHIFNSSTFVSNNSATSTSMQAYSSGITSSAKMSYPDFISQWSSISGLLAPFSSLDGLGTYMFNYEDIESGSVPLQTAFALSDMTTEQSRAESLDDTCLLWGTSCSGNRSMALRQFFGTVTIDDPLRNA